MVGNSCHSYDVLFRSYLGNSRSRAVNSNPKENLDFEVAAPPGGFGEPGAPPIPNVSTPFLPSSEKKKGVKSKSCFDLAENRAASCLWVGDHR